MPLQSLSILFINNYSISFKIVSFIWKINQNHIFSTSISLHTRQFSANISYIITWNFFLLRFCYIHYTTQDTTPPQFHNHSIWMSYQIAISHSSNHFFFWAAHFHLKICLVKNYCILFVIRRNIYIYGFDIVFTINRLYYGSYMYWLYMHEWMFIL